jgi:hypothetical protein
MCHGGVVSVKNIRAAPSPRYPFPSFYDFIGKICIFAVENLAKTCLFYFVSFSSLQ